LKKRKKKREIEKIKLKVNDETLTFIFYT